MSTVVVAHSADFRRVVRFVGSRHFGYDVFCRCGFKCSKHYKAGPAANCAVKHDRDSNKAEGRSDS